MYYNVGGVIVVDIDDKCMEKMKRKKKPVGKVKIIAGPGKERLDKK